MGDTDQSPVIVEVENLGGIDHVTETLSPGTNVLAGANATNRTSFLEALATGLGGQTATVKTDAEEGFVRLEIGEDTYERQLVANSAGTQPRIDGDGYMDDPESAELFAWLLADNDIRHALRTGGNLRDLAMRPIDTEMIEQREANLVADRQEIEAELAELEEKAERLPEIESEIQQLESEMEEREAKLAAKREELAAIDQDVEEAQQEQSDRDETLDALKEAQSQRESTRQTIEQQEEALAATKEELDIKRAALEEASEELADVEIDPDRVRTEIQNLQAEQDELRTLKESLNSIISFNEQQLHDDEPELWGLLRTGEASGVEQLTEQLGGDMGPEKIDCWTCGSNVEVTDIEDQLDRLRTQQEQLTGKLADLDEEIDALRSQHQRYQTLQDRIDELEAAIKELKDEVATRQSKIETQEERLAEINTEISELETKFNELKAETENENDVLALQREVNESEFEVEKIQRQFEQAEEQRDELKAELDRREPLAAEREEIVEELTAVRNEIDRRETAIVETFNEHMATLIDLLEYKNITRVWLEAKQSNGSGDTAFELHIVRETTDGRAYEDTVANLSESEREVIAITFSLAGYIAHDMHEEMPFILFDSVEMIDAARLDRLFKYFDEYADYIVAALLQEQMDEIANDDRRIVDFKRTTAIS